MSYLRHIRACNRWTPEAYRPFFIASRQYGWVRHDFAAVLAQADKVFTVGDFGVALNESLTTAETRTSAVNDAVEKLIGDGALNARMREEMFPVVRRFGEPEAMRINRGLLPVFGLRAFAVHVNGFVRTGADTRLWIGLRNPDKLVSPGKLDSMVGGGQPAGLSLRENLLKECAEEAGLTPDDVARAIPVGAVTYCMETQEGLRPDALYCFDLEVPAAFRPECQDDEIVEHYLWPMEDVLRRIRETDAFKFNVALVILYFAVRQGFITPDEEPDYLEILHGLRAGPYGPEPFASTAVDTGPSGAASSAAS